MFGHCFECGEGPIHIVFHHVIPKSQGGKAMIPLCETCHKKAHECDMSYAGLARSSLRRKMNVQKLYEKLDEGRSWMRGKKMVHLPTKHKFVCCSTHWEADNMIAIRIRPHAPNPKTIVLEGGWEFIWAADVVEVDGHPDSNPDYVWAKDCVLSKEN